MEVEKIPPIPTREQEIEYINYLEKSILTDPWITLRPKKHMANPWRLYWKKKFEMRREYYKTFAKNFFGTIAIAWPIIMFFARKRQYTKTGVPTNRVMPTNLFNPHNKLEIDTIRNKYTRRAFQYGLFKYSLLAGIAGGFFFTDWDFFTNDLNARPDLAQFRIMTDNVPDKERKVFEMFGNTYFGKPWPDTPDSWYKKLSNKFFPSVDYNPHQSAYLPFYDYKKGYFPSEDVSSYYSG
jgi:hypothetical protein